MINCSAVIPAGQAKNACFLDQPSNLLITELGKKFENYEELGNPENWRVLVQEELSAYVTLPIRTVAPNKPAENVETDGSGAEVTTRINPGGGLVDMKMTRDDFREFLESMNGAYYGVFIGLGANKVMAYEKPDGSLVGFTGQLTAMPIGFPSMDAKLAEFQMKINWDEVDEFNRFRIIELPFILSELTDYAPQGITLQVKTKLSGTDMVVKGTVRGSKTLETTTLTGEIIETNITDTPSITIVGPVNGEYTVTLEKSVVPEALEERDYINYRLVEKTVSVFDKVSNTINGRIYT